MVYMIQIQNCMNLPFYDHLSYDEMLNMKSRVLHDRCVEYAKQHHIEIYLKGTFSKGAGTLISS